jgi:RecA-family ATPase
VAENWPAVVGDSGLGKTPLGIQLGVCVAAGLPFMGLQVSQRGPVLYCDAESDPSGFLEILEAICRFALHAIARTAEVLEHAH